MINDSTHMLLILEEREGGENIKLAIFKLVRLIQANLILIISRSSMGYQILAILQILNHAEDETYNRLGEFRNRGG
jgi:hypothetical protein